MTSNSWNPYSWAVNAVLSPNASRSNKKRKANDINDGDVDDSTTNVTLESIMGEIDTLKKSNERIENLLKTLVEQTKGNESIRGIDEEEEHKESGVHNEENDGEEKASDDDGDNDGDQELNSAWLEKFEELRSFKKKHGHCIVARTSNPYLGRWIIRQRSEKKTGRMTNRAIKCAKLNSIDFDWTPQPNTPARKKK